MSTDLVFAGADGEPFTTSLVIATETGNEHRSVLQLIRTHLGDLNEIGRVAFEMRPFETAGGTQRREVAHLNEPAAALLITNLRGNAIVFAFRKRLVAGFYEMRQRLAARPAALTDDELIHRALQVSSRRIAALAEKVAELEPKADAYDHFLDATGKYSVGAVAQILGTSQNKLFRELRNRGVFIAMGARRNTPYQQYAHHFEVIPHSFERSNGEHGCSYTTYVQPSGIDFIRRKLADLLAVGAGVAGCES